MLGRFLSMVRPVMMDKSVPFLGHALELRRDPVDFILRGRRRHGDVFGMKLPGADTVVFSGLKADGNSDGKSLPSIRDDSTVG